MTAARRLSRFAFLTAAVCAACGDVGSVDVKLNFPDDATRASTRRLVLITREAGATGDICGSLWTMAQVAANERRVAIDYPNRNDIVAAPISFSVYPRVGLFVYAHSSKDTQAVPAIAGGCQTISPDPNSTTHVVVNLQKSPKS